MAIPRRVAFVRAIMIGREGLQREVVLDLFREAGAIEPRNHLATGNISFAAVAADIPAITAFVEAGIVAIVGRPKPRCSCGRSITCNGSWLTTRSTDEPAVRSCSCLPERRASSSHWSRERASLRCSRRTAPSCSLSAAPGEAPGGLIERALGVSVTVRAWSTIAKIVAAHERS
jgi:hypothetical protein